MSGLFKIDLLYANPLQNGSYVLIEGEVVTALHEFRQLSAHHCEAGGILIGYRRQQHLHVVEFTTPAAGDRRARYEFDRRDPYHARWALERWRKSHAKLDCVGEWHTHPEEVPSPSNLDRSEWRGVLSRIEQMRLFLIVGLSADWLGVGQRRRLSPAIPVI